MGQHSPSAHLSKVEAILEHASRVMLSYFLCISMFCVDYGYAKAVFFTIDCLSPLAFTADLTC